ncbi:MAG: hypothetical protein NC911_03495, partial [Candidatus Omnitrophica bacterium]|nr:hypothetical protein [Candidatus Omnitrophota bacterium]
ILYGRKSFLLTQGGHCGRKVNFVYFREVPGKPLVIRLTTEAKETLVDIGTTGTKEFLAGYCLPLGKGKIIYLGSNPSPEILRIALEEEGLAPYVCCQQEKVTTDLHQHKEGHFILFVINRNNEPVSANCSFNLERLKISQEQCFSVTPLGKKEESVQVSGKQLTRLSLMVESHDVGIWLLKPSGSR